MEQVIVPTVPDALWRFMREACRLPANALESMPASALPEPAKRLLVHVQDMTTTLATFHEAALRVDILQRQRHQDLYVREVFLRTVPANAIVEYGVIGIALDQFAPEQQAAIEAGIAPLGALLHRFEIPFQSAPVGFFRVAAEALADTPFAPREDAMCFGRFNRLSKPTGEPLAWILEILPPSEA